MSEFLTSEADTHPLKELPRKKSFTGQAWPIAPPTSSSMERRCREIHVHQTGSVISSDRLFLGITQQVAFGLRFERE